MEQIVVIFILSSTTAIFIPLFPFIYKEAVRSNSPKTPLIIRLIIMLPMLSGIITSIIYPLFNLSSHPALILHLVSSTLSTTILIFIFKNYSKASLTVPQAIIVLIILTTL